MSASGGSLQIRTPRVRTWQAFLVAAVLVMALAIGTFAGRASGPGTAHLKGAAPVTGTSSGPQERIPLGRFGLTGSHR